jgi:hypothetical protein
MKTKLLSLLFALCISFTTTAQAPGWLWAQNAPTITTDFANQSPGRITIDTGGNLIVTGTTEQQSITFGNTTITTTAGYVGSSDIFIVKYDASGNILWAKCMGGVAYEQINSVCTDANGNILLTGYFNSPSMVVGSTTLTNTGLFIAKLDASGNVLWAQSAGGNGGGKGMSVSTDASGNVFTTGWFAGPALVLGSSTLTASINSAHIYVAKYDVSGNVLWTKSVDGNIDDIHLNIKADLNGNVFLGGAYFANGVNFGNNVTLNAPGAYANLIFLAKLDAAGNALWAKSSINSNVARCNDMDLDASGNVFLAGWFFGDSLAMGSTTLTNPTSTSLTDNKNLFVAKYDALGNVLWAKSAGGVLDEEAQGISTDAGGNVFISGYFSSPTVAFGNSTITNVGTSNIFVAKYDASGNPLWAQSAGGAYDDGALDVCTGAGGAAYISGFYESTSVAMGSTTLTNNNNPPTGQLSGVPTGYFFIAKTGSVVSTGLEENTADAVKIFPNPFSTQVMVQAGQPLKEATLTLVNSLGQTVKQIMNISEQSIRISRGDLPAGIYFMNILQGDKFILTEKLLITD